MAKQKRAKNWQWWLVKYWYGRDHTNTSAKVAVPPGYTLNGMLRHLGIKHVYSTKRLKDRVTLHGTHTNKKYS